MGPEHLIRAVGLSLALAATACGHRGGAAPSVAAPKPRHVQFVPALTTPQRHALIERFRQRNGREWTVNEDALASNTVLDPFLGFVRRARTNGVRPAAAARIDGEAAAVAARAFVRKNADLLGVAPSKLLSLSETLRPVAPEDHASPRAAWAVKLEATYPTKGYESFKELTNEIALEVFVDDDGAPSSFVNLSKIHPRLTIDTRPGLPEDDGRIYENVVGRRVFALAEDGDRKIELGRIERQDLLDAKIAIEITPGPLGAWLTYRLAWMIVASKSAPEEGGFYFFFWLVDTDTTEVVRDSPVPRQPESELFP